MRTHKHTVCIQVHAHTCTHACTYTHTNIHNIHTLTYHLVISISCLSAHSYVYLLQNVKSVKDVGAVKDAKQPNVENANFVQLLI